VKLRAGIHTGEVDLGQDGVTGISVQLTVRVAALARPGEILVSRTVRELVTGSGISFAERGHHELYGEGEPWPLFAVAAT
jgi:class 3 adenylate cyclase